MSVLVAALTRTKNNFTNSLLKSESKSSSRDGKSKDGKSRSKFPPPKPKAAQPSSSPPAQAPAPLPLPTPAVAQTQAEAATAAAAVSTTGNAGTTMTTTATDPAGTSQGEDVAAVQGDLQRQFSARSCADSEEEECESAPVADDTVLEALGPMMTIKEQLDRDKEDESLRRWKEKLLGSSAVLDSQVVDPEVKFHTLGLTSPNRPVITVPLPLTSSKGVTFSLKEGSSYRLRFTFTVLHNIVSGLTYVHTVWKSGLQVDHSRIMLGTFSPQRDPYTHLLDEETTPSGVLARGSYTARTKFVDDDERCYLEINYSFDIRKEW